MKTYTASNTTMDVSERKKAIKMSADLAMASARNGTTIWSRAIIAKSMKDRVPAELVLSHPVHGVKLSKLGRKKTTMVQTKGRRRVGRRATRRSNFFPPSKAFARLVAKRLVEKRRKVLRSLVPGGEFMEDEVLLIEETLDYISFLRAQVDGMRFLASCK